MRKQNSELSKGASRKGGLGAILRSWFSGNPASTPAQDVASEDPLTYAPAIENPAAPEPDEANSDSMDELISQFRLAMSALNTLGADSDPAASEDTVKLPLHFLLGLLPEHYIVSRELDNVPLREPISVGIRDLFKQLAAGQIITNVSSLVRSLPPKLITREGFADDQTAIVVPLPQVVAGLPPGALKKHTPQEKVKYKIAGLPNLFVALTPQELQAQTSKAGGDSSGATGAAPAAAGEAGRPPAHAAAPAGTDTGLERVVYDVKLTHADSGVDLNMASAEQIGSIEGISVELANRIVSHRREHGEFSTVFDLMQVQGINRKIFRTITGMPFNRQHLDRSQVLAKMLSIPEGSVGHLPTVARVVGQHENLNGCMVSDGGGLLLAQYGIAADSDALAAVVPRMFKQIQDNMHKIVVSDVRSASICVEGKMFTIVTGGHIYITVVQLSSKFSKDLHKYVARVAHELEWVLSHRGYVKPGRPDAAPTALDVSENAA